MWREVHPGIGPTNPALCPLGFENDANNTPVPIQAEGKENWQDQRPIDSDRDSEYHSKDFREPRCETNAMIVQRREWDS